MSNDLPIAVVTMSFSRLITGSQLGALMQRVVQQNGEGFRLWVDERYYDGEAAGFSQTSGSSCGNIRVVPSLEGSPFFVLSAPYSEVKVTELSRSGQSRTSIIEAVKAFAAALEDAYDAALAANFFPEYVNPLETVQDYDEGESR